MKLDQETIEAIMGVIIRPSEIREVMARINVEEEFRERLHKMRCTRTVFADYLFDCEAEIGTLFAEFNPMEAQQDQRDQAARRLREYELLLNQLLNQCHHWTKWSDGTCRVCGVKGDQHGT